MCLCVYEIEGDSAVFFRHVLLEAIHKCEVHSKICAFLHVRTGTRLMDWEHSGLEHSFFDVVVLTSTM